MEIYQKLSSPRSGGWPVCCKPNWFAQIEIQFLVHTLISTEHQWHTSFILTKCRPKMSGCKKQSNKSRHNCCNPKGETAGWCRSIGDDWSAEEVNVFISDWRVWTTRWYSLQRLFIICLFLFSTWEILFPSDRLADADHCAPLSWVDYTFRNILQFLWTAFQCWVGPITYSWNSSEREGKEVNFFLLKAECRHSSNCCIGLIASKYHITDRPWAKKIKS